MMAGFEVSGYTKEKGVKAALKLYSEYDGKYVGLIEEVYAELKCGKRLSEIMKVIDDKSGKKIIV